MRCGHGRQRGTWPAWRVVGVVTHLPPLSVGGTSLPTLGYGEGDRLGNRTLVYSRSELL
jgi:hypothetical protein